MSELEDLKAQILDLQMEVDILKGILDVLKKDPGTDWRTLKNREKAVTIGAMKNNYLHWYNEDRIEESLGYMSPEGYRA